MKTEDYLRLELRGPNGERPGSCGGQCYSVGKWPLNWDCRIGSPPVCARITAELPDGRTPAAYVVGFEGRHSPVRVPAGAVCRAVRMPGRGA